MFFVTTLLHTQANNKHNIVGCSCVHMKGRL